MLMVLIKRRNEADQCLPIFSNCPFCSEGDKWEDLKKKQKKERKKEGAGGLELHRTCGRDWLTMHVSVIRGQVDWNNGGGAPSSICSSFTYTSTVNPASTEEDEKIDGPESSRGLHHRSLSPGKKDSVWAVSRTIFESIMSREYKDCAQLRNAVRWYVQGRAAPNRDTRWWGGHSEREKIRNIRERLCVTGDDTPSPQTDRAISKGNAAERWSTTSKCACPLYIIPLTTIARKPLRPALL